MCGGSNPNREELFKTQTFSFFAKRRDMSSKKSKSKSLADKLLILYLLTLLISEFVSYFIAPIHSKGYGFHIASEIGFFAFLFISFLNFNERKRLKTKTEGMSIGVNLSFAIGQLVWLTYGLSQI
jgi:hypothetical protein